MNNEERKEEQKGSQEKKITDVFLKGAQDATSKTKQYSPKVKKEVDSVLKEVAYAAGYIPGLVNGLLNEFITKDVRNSLKKGAFTGCDKAKSVAGKLKKKLKTPSNPQE